MHHRVHSIIGTVFFILSYGIYSPVTHAQISDGGAIMPEIVSKDIKTVNIHREGWKLSYPIIDLRGSARLLLSFDDFSGQINNYYYKIVHCNADWTPSSLSESEYLDGFLQNQITDYAYSFNTYFSYIHYSLKLPNDDVQFKVSGNYAIIVYKDYNEDDTVFVKRFFVAEKQVDVNVNIKRPALSMYRDNGQEVDFTVDYGSFNIDDPYSNLKVTILQNGRWDNAITGLKPLYDRYGVLDYDYNMENVFKAGNEFRWFDFKSFRYQSPYIKSVEFSDGHYHVELFPDQVRAGQVYFYEEDINGKYYIEVQEENNNNTDADYAFVDFTLKMSRLPEGQDVYVMGELTNWLFDDHNRMTWDPAKQAYTLQLVLKQGYYNYEFGIVEDGAHRANTGTVEGNYYETENDYIILVYYHGTTSRYERIVGYQISNSLHQDDADRGSNR